jgi:hypothetical protein
MGMTRLASSSLPIAAAARLRCTALSLENYGGVSWNGLYVMLGKSDSFWAARRDFQRRDDPGDRALRRVGDPAAEKAIGDILIERRNTIVRTYLP